MVEHHRFSHPSWWKGWFTLWYPAALMRTQTLRFYGSKCKLAWLFRISRLLWDFSFDCLFAKNKNADKTDLPKNRIWSALPALYYELPRPQRTWYGTYVIRCPLVVFACLSRQVRQMTWQGSCAQGCPSRRKCRALFSFYMRFDPARIIVTVLGAKISMVSWLFEWTRRIIVAWQFWHCTLISLSLFLKPETNCPQLAQNHEYACQSSFANRWYSPYFRHGRNKG